MYMFLSIRWSGLTITWLSPGLMVTKVANVCSDFGVGATAPAANDDPVCGARVAVVVVVVAVDTVLVATTGATAATVGVGCWVFSAAAAGAVVVVATGCFFSAADAAANDDDDVSGAPVDTVLVAAAGWCWYCWLYCCIKLNKHFKSCGCVSLFEIIFTPLYRV